MFKALKALSFLTATAFTLLLAAQFFDVRRLLPAEYAHYDFASYNVWPSLVAMLAAGTIAAGAAFMFFCAAALVCGRVFCGAVCPLGFLMDLSLRLSRTWPLKLLFKRRRFKHKKSPSILRACALFAALGLTLAGLNGLVGLFEPYALWGKIMRLALAPAATAANNLAASFNDEYAGGFMQKVHIQNVPAAFTVLGFALLGALFIASALRGRLFCNTLCPVGALLGALSKFAAVKIALNPHTCISCGKCESVCKAECIDFKNFSVDSSKCVMCFECGAQCPNGSVVFKAGKRILKSDCAQNQVSAKEDIGRRAFAKSVLPLAALGVAGFKNLETRAPKIQSAPPGATGVKNFTDNCIACQLCAAQCPTNVLKPALAERGLAGFLQPYMDFDSSYCRYTCHECSKVCPTEAIRFISGREKHALKIGTAVFFEQDCIAALGKECTACAEICPVNAIAMTFKKNNAGILIPTVNVEMCVGCGACQYVCPSAPKALIIEGLMLHENAAVKIGKGEGKHKRSGK